MYKWAAGRQLQQIDMMSANAITAESGTNSDGSIVVTLAHTAKHRLGVQVVENDVDVTAETSPSQFVWYKRANDEAAWEQVAAGTKELSLVQAEMDAGYQYKCSYTDIVEDYGNLNVDSALTLSHDPDIEDANDTFSLNNGVLSLTTDRTNADYYLENGSLKIAVTDGATISAEASFSERSILKSIYFSYDHNGLRTQKKVVDNENNKTTTYDYTLHGKLITHLTKREVDPNKQDPTIDELHFFYDAQSRPAFVEYNNIKYRYIHNLQGDIVAIVDTAGTRVVEYKYDAWGKPIYEAGSLLSTLGSLNPFRYRGYVLDVEIGLYYLRSRYFEPRLNRFLNADNELAEGNELLRHNVFAYCGNMPLMIKDENGQGWLFFAAVAVIGAVVGAVAQVTTNIATGKEWDEGIAGAVVGGAVYNVVALATNSTAAAGYSAAAAESMTNEVVSYITGDTELTEENVKDSVAKVAIDTTINGTIYTVTGKMANSYVPTNNGWFQPQKVSSAFCGKYAQKVWGQTAAQAVYNTSYNVIKNGVDGIIS